MLMLPDFDRAGMIGDYNAVRRGRIGRRLVNKAIGRWIVSKLWRR